MPMTANGDHNGEFLRQAPSWFGFILSITTAMLLAAVAYGVLYQKVEHLRAEDISSADDRARIWGEIAKALELRNVLRVDVTGLIRDVSNLQGYLNRLDGTVSVHEKNLQNLQISIAPIAEMKDLQEKEIIERRERGDKIDENLQGLQVQLARMNLQQENLADQLEGLVAALQQSDRFFPNSGDQKR